MTTTEQPATTETVAQTVTVTAANLIAALTAVEKFAQHREGHVDVDTDDLDWPMIAFCGDYAEVSATDGGFATATVRIPYSTGQLVGESIILDRDNMCTVTDFVERAHNDPDSVVTLTPGPGTLTVVVDKTYELVVAAEPTEEPVTRSTRGPVLTAAGAVLAVAAYATIRTLTARRRARR